MSDPTCPYRLDRLADAKPFDHIELRSIDRGIESTRRFIFGGYDPLFLEDRTAEGTRIDSSLSDEVWVIGHVEKAWPVEGAPILVLGFSKTSLETGLLGDLPTPPFIAITARSRPGDHSGIILPNRSFLNKSHLGEWRELTVANQAGRHYVAVAEW